MPQITHKIKAGGHIKYHWWLNNYLIRIALATIHDLSPDLF